MNDMSRVLELVDDLIAAKATLHSIEGEDSWRGDGASQHARDAQTEVERIEREVEALAPSWQPIETASKDGTVILGLEIQSTLGDEQMRLPIQWIGGRWSLAWTAWADESDDCTPTHWMPLPEPPGT